MNWIYVCETSFLVFFIYLLYYLSLSSVSSSLKVEHIFFFYFIYLGLGEFILLFTNDISSSQLTLLARNVFFSYFFKKLKNIKIMETSIKYILGFVYMKQKTSLIGCLVVRLSIESTYLMSEVCVFFFVILFCRSCAKVKL